MNVTSGDEEALKMAIAVHGPVAVGIDAAHKSFSFYSHGVFYEPDCKSGPDDMDHAVVAVGYGELDGEPYWLVKNSWSTYWGNDGYILMSRKDNNCGVTTGKRSSMFMLIHRLRLFNGVSVMQMQRL